MARRAQVQAGRVAQGTSQNRDRSAAQDGTAPPRNRLLATLPPAVLERIRPLLQPQSFRYREVMMPADTPMDAVVFPETGWTSLMVTLLDGAGAEVGLVGREGMVGLPLLLGTDRMPLEVQWQSDGTALRLEAAAFRALLEESEPFRTLLLRYAMAHTTQVSLIAACNVRHSVEQRLGRWMLMAHDRAEADQFSMTHDQLSVILGVRRAGITVAVGALQRAGAIRSGGGRVTVLSRRVLKEAACECYGSAKREYTRLLRCR